MDRLVIDRLDLDRLVLNLIDRWFMDIDWLMDRLVVGWTELLKREKKERKRVNENGREKEKKREAFFWINNEEMHF